MWWNMEASFYLKVKYTTRANLSIVFQLIYLLFSYQLMNLVTKNML